MPQQPPLPAGRCRCPVAFLLLYETKPQEQSPERRPAFLVLSHGFVSLSLSLSLCCSRVVFVSFSVLLSLVVSLLHRCCTVHVRPAEDHWGRPLVVLDSSADKNDDTGANKVVSPSLKERPHQRGDPWDPNMPIKKWILRYVRIILPPVAPWKIQEKNILANPLLCLSKRQFFGQAKVEKLHGLKGRGSSMRSRLQLDQTDKSLVRKSDSPY